MSGGGRKAVRAMQEHGSSREMLVRVRVRLEPELELMAATWTPAQCEAHAKKLERFARQLRVKAAITRGDQKPLPRRLKQIPSNLALRN